MSRFFVAIIIFAFALICAPAGAQFNGCGLGFCTSGPQGAAGSVSYTASGPSSGTTGSPSTNFTVALCCSVAFTGSDTITIADGSQGGTITPSVGSPGTSTVTVTPTSGTTSFTFTYNAASNGVKTLTFTNAQSWVNPLQLSYTASGGGGGYTGPLDVIASNVVGCWALRACSAAARGTAAINLCNPGDVACADVSSDATTGAIPTSITVGSQACSVTVSSGTYDSSTGHVVLTTATSPGLSSGNNLFAELTGTGSIASLNGQYVATAGTSGTTVDFTAGSGLTLTITGGTVSPCTVKTIYDQSAAAACAGSTACSLTQATIGTRGVLAANTINTTHWSISLEGGEGYNSANNLPTITQPYTQSLVAQSFGTNPHSNTVFSSSAGGDLFGFDASGAANTGTIYNGAYGTWTANDNAWNAMDVVANAASSIYNDNGTAGTPSGNPGTASLPSGTMQMGFYTGAGTLFFQGLWAEGEFWKATSTSTQLNNIVSNQRGSTNAGWNF